MAYETIIFEKKDKIGYIVFNRPDAFNAANEQMFSELELVMDEIEADNQLGALILTGAGKAFQAGADIKMLARAKEAGYGFYLLHDKLMRFILRMERLRIPVIAAINGYAFGGGLEITTGCDIRIASENAKLGTPEVGLGIMPGAGATARLPRLIGKGKALELELTGDPIDAKEACSIGLVNKVVPEGEALKAAEELASRILKNAPLAIAQIKNAIQVGTDMPLEGASEYCQKNAMMTMLTQDAEEGTRAFVEKRSPVWQGK